MALEVRPLTLSERESAFDDLARLRIEVFRAFPYLYDGDLDYERRYLADFLASPAAVLVAAFDGTRVVGAATASPLADHEAALTAPFAESGIAPEDVFYFGESVLQPGYRGQGAGVRFFQHREAAARRAASSMATFCAVVRPKDHPLRPTGYVPLDGFWRRRGYERLDGIATEFSWRDVGEAQETAKPMQFWGKTL